MEADDKKLNYFSEEGVKVEIPFFQRPYVWKEKHWNDLYIAMTTAKDKMMPFIGSFIFQETENENEYIVIDGQQRITTLFVIIKAFLDVIGNEIDAGAITKFKNIIYEAHTDSSLNTTYLPRLTPSLSDQNSFNIIMQEKIDQNKLESDNSPIVSAYKYFYKKFKTFDVQTLIQTIGSRIITKYEFFIVVVLEENEDEQKIFDSVNRLGERLTNGDIIKNYLFNRLKSFYDYKDKEVFKEVLKIYNDNWEIPFYSEDRKEFWYEPKKFGGEQATHLEAFLKDFATIKGFFKLSGNEGLSNEYKNQIDKMEKDDLIKFINEIKEYGDCYYNMMNDYSDLTDFRISDRLNTTLLILNELESTTFTSVILKLYKNKETDYEKVLFQLQKFVLTNLIYECSTKNYDKVAETMISKSNAQECISYLENYIIENHKPDYKNFPKGLSYINSRSNYKATLILFLIEMIRRNTAGEDKYSDALVYNKSLEHVLPQKRKKWKDVPCYDYNAEGEYAVITDIKDIDLVRDAKTYSIGNMTLLTGKLNTSISNDIISVKIDGNGKKDGIRKFVGSLSISSEIVEAYDKNKKWDERDINERAEKLFNELNNYYNFTKDYVKKNVPIVYNQIDDNDTINQDKVRDELTEDFLNNQPIGIVVRESFKYLMSKNKLSEEDISNLCNKEYSSDNLGCWLPALATELDDKTKKRYYKDTIKYNGINYRLCKEWYKEDRLIIINWIKSKLD